MNFKLQNKVKLKYTWRTGLFIAIISNLLFFITLNASKSFSFFFNKKTETTAIQSPQKEKKARQFKRVLTPEMAYFTLNNISQNLLSPPTMMLAPSISATNTVTVKGGGGAAPSSQLDYVVVISNSASAVAGNDATGVVFTDILSSDLTLIADSVKASPIAVNDSYNSIGNVGITVSNTEGVISNDISPDNTVISAKAVTNAVTTNNGTITIAANGSFSYTPAAGFNGTDTYTYTLNSTNGLSGTGVITFTVTTPIWFINASYAGGGSNGTLAKPFTTVSAFQAINNNATTNSGQDGDYIFVYSGSYSSSAVTLLASQKLIGQAAANSIASITGLSIPTYSNTLPTTGGATTTIANTAATAITLGTSNEIQGVSVTTTSGTTMSGASVGALKIRDVSLTASAGRALLISAGGALDVQFKSISAAGVTNGISVNSSSGTFQVLGTGTTAGSGGTINNMTTRGAEFISCQNVSLKNMTFTNANTSTSICSTPATDNSGCNAAIHLKTISSSAVFDNISITGTNNAMGININNVSGFSLVNSTITGCGSANAAGNEAGGIYALNMIGTCSIINSNINNSNGRNFYCRNSSSLTNLTVTGSQFKNTFGTSNGGSCFSFEGYGTSNNTVIIKSSDFSNANTYGLFLAFGNSTVNTVQVGGTTLAEGNTITAAATSPGSNGFALQGASNLTGSINYNILNNNFQSSYNGVDIFNIGNQGSGAMQGRCISNTATALNGINSNGIYVAQYGTGTNKTDVQNNTVSGTKNYGIGVESNDNALSSVTARMDATVKNNNVSMLDNAYAHVGVIAVSNVSSSTSLISCANVGGNITNTPAGLAAGHLDVLALKTGTSNAQIIFQGTTVFVPNTPQPIDQTAKLTTFWNANNTGTRTAIDEQGGGTVIAGTCLTPSNPAASLLAENENSLSLESRNNITEIESKTSNKVNTDIHNDISENSSTPQYFDSKTSGKMPSVAQNETPQALNMSAETVTVNGSGSGFTIPAGKSTTIRFSATISATPSACTISNQGTVTGSNISSVLTDDPGVAGSANPTNVIITLAAPSSPTISSTNICSGQSVTLSAISSIGTLNWWKASTGGTSVATGTPYSPTNITTPTTYYASNILGGCESARTLAGSVSIKPLPSATITATPTSICKNSTLNLSAPSGATTYSWAGNGIVTANANATTAVPNAAGTQTYSLTVTGSNSCTNSSTTDVIVNNLPTPIITGATTGCEAISLLASGGVNYAWSGGATPATANNVVASSGAYTVTVTDGNNCMATTSTTVTINPITFEGINLDPVTSKPIPQTSTYNLDGSNEHMYMGTDCNIIGKVMPFGASPAMGNTISKVWYEPTQPANFVRRHHEITPSANASTSTGKVKLYFTQQDFNDFNAVNAVKLPTGSGDATGISNILIEKLGGTSSDGSGLPNKYSGSTATINPDDTDIVWNATYSRWEITFSVDGFSGFFVKTQSALLPVELLSFKGQYTEGGNFLTWKTASENNNKGFEIERSVDGQLFTKIGWLEGHGNSNILNSYSFLDKNHPQSINYYRLKQLDNSDKSTYSNVISLANEKIFTLKVYPNPANDVLSLSINQTGEYPYSITDMLGQIVKKGVIGEQSNINISTLSPGTYFLKCNETFVKFVKNK